MIISYFSILIILPLLTGFIIYIFGDSKWIALAIYVFMGLGILFSIYCTIHTARPIYYSFEWLNGFRMGWAFDRLGLLLITLVYFVSLLVMVFSIHYLKNHTSDFRRFYLKLGCFISAMIGLLGADHLLLIFIFWELIGLFSYLLIGFWYAETKRVQAARNAYITNRIADAFLIFAILYQWSSGGSLFISELESQVSAIVAIGILIGAMGKSAQFPFHTWLPHAMAGPTPVSALIHAATLVASGIYLLIRASSIFPEDIRLLTAVIGSFTMLLASLFALFQWDIKKVLAYSTVSQLGYMVFAVGIGRSDFAFLHLIIHAFFKSGLFLCAANIIQYQKKANPKMDGQDMRYMDGVFRSLPITSIVFMICSAALVGIPFFSGSLSKENILAASLSKEWWFFVNSFAGVALTAFYSFRQLFLIFGKSNNIKVYKGLEPLITVKIPLVILGLLSLWFWYSTNPISHRFWLIDLAFEYSKFKLLGNAPLVLGLSILLISFMFGMVFLAFKKNRTLGSGHALIVSILHHGIFIDSFYRFIFIRPFNAIGKFISSIDSGLLEKSNQALGYIIVILSKVLFLIDIWIIDGMVRLMTVCSSRLGIAFNSLQYKNIQKQLRFILLMLLLIMFILFKNKLIGRE